MNLDVVRATPPADRSPERAALRRVAVELETVFLAQLLQAMRESMPAPEDSGAQAQETFGFFMDQRLAELAGGRDGHGLADAIERQLARRAGLTPPGGSEPAGGAGAR